MRAVRTLLVMLTVAPLAATSAAAQGRPETPPPPGSSIQMPRLGGMAGSMVGIRLGDVSADQVKTFKLPKAEGAIVESVNPNSPAATGGIRANDVIVEFDGEHVRSARHLSRLVSDTPAGREVSLVVMRDGKRNELRVKPEAGNWFNPQFGRAIDRDEMREYSQEVGRAAREMTRNLPDIARLSSRGRLGASVQEMTPELAEHFGVKSGVLVASVSKDSPAEKAGLKAGDVITAVDGHEVATPGELVRALPANEGTHDVTLTVTRDKKEMKLKATLESPRSRRTSSSLGV